MQDNVVALFVLIFRCQCHAAIFETIFQRVYCYWCQI